jgi:hypothetical protein
MPKYQRTAITSKEGVNFIRNATESAGSLFVKIDHESDLGVDALIEFVQDERPLNKQVAVQIKSGASYYSEKMRECVFPIDGHGEYWAKHPLPVVALVYVPSLQSAFWASIKGMLKADPYAKVIRFPASEASRFDVRSFSNIFLPTVVGSVPTLEFEEAFKLARSAQPDETYLGLLVLFRRYPDNSATWDELIRVFKSRPAREIPPVLVYWLAHIPGHGDIFYFGKTASQATLEYARALLATFELEDVVKLLSFIDPEEQIGRGTLGQSVEAILWSLPRSGELLRLVIASTAVEMSAKEFAALILAMNDSDGAILDLQVLEGLGSRYASEIRKHLEEFGEINPY